MNRPTVPDVLPRALAYYRKHPTGGSLHIVLDDGNVSDANVDFCIRFAKQEDDAEGLALAHELRTMSRTQRTKLGRRVFALVP